MALNFIFFSDLATPANAIAEAPKHHKERRRIMNMINHTLLLLLFSLSSLRHALSFSNNDTDHEALLAFMAATTDPSNSLRSWTSTLDFCKWSGVTCSRRRRQRVTGLNLVNRTLSGSISPHLGNISFLRFLYLDNNSFAGVLPPQLGNLKRLRNFSISYNLIEGEIPASLSNCANLVSLVLSYNRLGGVLPLELGSLSSLRLLSISRNSINGGIPPTFGNLSSLTRLYCGSNDLAGDLPDSLGRLRRLELLAFGENMITGSIPPTIFNLSSISVFDLAANQIRGSLPSDLGIFFPNLDFFSVGINMLTGSIPASLSNVSSLRYLHAGYNQFSGDLPSFMKMSKLNVLGISGNLLGKGGTTDLSFVSSLINATNLASLGLDDNGFGGDLPLEFWNLSTSISRIFLSQNQISGNFPSDVGKFVQLQDLRLNENRFIGMIPASIGNLRNLQFLDLSNNRFSSRIPSSIGNLSLLLYLHLSHNNLASSIPSSLANCQNLLELNLSQNGLTGSLAREVLRLPSLRSIDLSQNQLNSTLPTEIGNLKNLEYLNVSRNGFFGSIHNTIGSCVRLEFLDLQANSFIGNIPSSLSSLRGLQVLDLSSNKFDGPVPSFLAEFSFLALNLSFNDLEGALPEEGVFKSASSVSAAGNARLCGGVPALKLPKCNLKRLEKSSLTSALRIVLISTGVVLTAIVGSLIFCCLKRRKSQPVYSSFGNSLLQVSYQTLYQSTGGFSEEFLLGVGSYGSVYRGVLGEERKLVAVKVLNLSQHGAAKSFLAECEALKNIRHRNLVKVITACSGFDRRGNEFKALVYEFMPNGSLHEWLHPDANEDQTRGRARRLGLVQRLNITIDIACAVDYLHHQCGEAIIHCDIKPSNVLLDDDLVGHVSDFGLARFLNKTHEESSSLIRGTIGYTAPEYGLGGEATTSGDVYSFRILVLEVFTGRAPTDEMFRDGFGIHSFVKNRSIDEVADPSLVYGMENGDEDQMIMMEHDKDKLRHCLFEVLKVGVGCSVDSAMERMRISDAAGKLKSIRNDLLRENAHGR